jgi:hypothetical protein
MCGILSLPFAILGALFGVIGIIIATLTKKSYVGLPIAGMIVSITATFIVIIVTGSVASSIEKNRSNTNRSQSQPQHLERSNPGSTNDADEQPKAATVSKEGDNVHVGYMTYAVWQSWWSNRLSDNQFLDQRPNAAYLFVELTVRNNDKQARTVPPLELIDENDAEYEASSNGWAVKGAIDILESLNPSVSKQGFVVFDVPKDRKYRLKLSGGYWSSEDAYVQLAPKSNR